MGKWVGEYVSGWRHTHTHRMRSLFRKQQKMPTSGYNKGGPPLLPLPHPPSQPHGAGRGGELGAHRLKLGAPQEPYRQWVGHKPLLWRHSSRLSRTAWYVTSWVNDFKLHSSSKLPSFQGPIPVFCNSRGKHNLSSLGWEVFN